MPLRHFIKSHPGWYSWTVVVGSSIVTAVLAILVATNTQHKSEQKFCSLIEVLTGTRDEAPPTTERGRLIADRLEVLGRQLRCEEVKK